MSGGTMSHTKAVLYKNVAIQRTSKKTNLTLLISPFIFCGLLFLIQYIIDFIFLDRPEFRVSPTSRWHSSLASPRLANRVGCTRSSC